MNYNEKEMFNQSWLKNDNWWVKALLPLCFLVGLVFLILRLLIIIIIAAVGISLAHMGITVLSRPLLLLGALVCGWIPVVSGWKNMETEHAVVVSNHITMFDHLVCWFAHSKLLFLSNPMKGQNIMYKLFWPVMKPFTVTIDSKQTVVQLADSVKKQCELKQSKLFVFPEGTVGNGKHLYEFRSFAFTHGDVLPLAIKAYPAFPFIRLYPFMCNQLAHVLLMIAMPFVIYRVKILPVVSSPSCTEAKAQNSKQRFPGFYPVAYTPAPEPKQSARVGQMQIAEAIKGIPTTVSKKDKYAEKEKVKQAKWEKYLATPDNPFDVSALR
jgi:1-acyl-sn-glycerol-3-phosphate acyltransferase